MYASSVQSAQRHKDKLAASLAKKVARGKMEQAAADDIMSRILVEEMDAAADADLVIECVAENMAVKKDLLAKLDAMCKDSTIFATSTSLLCPLQAQGLKRHPEGGHALLQSRMPAMKLVEVIAGELVGVDQEPVPEISILLCSCGRGQQASLFLIKRGRLRPAAKPCCAEDTILRSWPLQSCGRTPC